MRLGNTATEGARPIPVAEIVAVARAWANPEDRSDLTVFLYQVEC